MCGSTIQKLFKNPGDYMTIVSMESLTPTIKYNTFGQYDNTKKRQYC